MAVFALRDQDYKK